MSQAGRDAEAWLWLPASELPAPPSVGEILRTYRGVHDMSQQELADFLGFDQSYISRIESGRRKIRDVGHLRLMAERLAIPTEELAIAAGMLGSVEDDRSLPIGHLEDERAAAIAQTISVSQRQWRLVRQGMNRRRVPLTEIAASLHADVAKVPRTSLLMREDWFPAEPVDLDDIALTWDGNAVPPLLAGSESETEAVRPLADAGRRFERYSRAIRDVDAPTLFENRLSYRLLEVEPGSRRLTFGLTSYFDMVDICEAVAHELAAPWLRHTPSPGQGAQRLWPDLPFRQSIGDVFDLARRPVLPSISILTIRRSSSSAAFILHDRDPARVAVAGGMFQVMPSGVFQPSSISPLDLQHDFDLWHNVLREFSEEFLGNPEHDGSAVRPIDYDATEPFRSLNKARREGKMRIYYFGIGMDPLTLAGEIIGVAVIDDDVFESVFEAFVDRNAEGIAVAAASDARASQGIPFTRPSIDRLRNAAVMAPAGSACLELAWRHRALLLDA